MFERETEELDFWRREEQRRRRGFNCLVRASRGEAVECAM